MYAWIMNELKEKLPQAFMQIGWMEDDFRNLANSKSLGKFGSSKQEIWFFKGFIIFVYVALSCDTLLISVMLQQYNCRMELYTIIFLNTTSHFSWKCIFPLLLYCACVVFVLCGPVSSAELSHYVMFCLISRYCLNLWYKGT